MLAHMNHNVKLAFLWTIFETASASIRAGDILSAYIYLQTGDNAVVGFVQGVNGIMQMVASFPAGWLADTFRRDWVLRAAACLGVLGAGALAASLYLSLPWHFLAASMALLGTYRGFNNPPLETIFADSVPGGSQGSSLYTAKHVIMQLSSIAGPGLSILMFLVLGDRWDLRPCRLVVLTGLVLMIIPLVAMNFFDDDKALQQPNTPRQGALAGTASEASLAEKGALRRSRGCCGCCQPQLLAPVLITVSDLLSALASGMTVKFFTLFFLELAHFGPMAVSALSLLGSLGISAVSIAAQRTSRRLGRLQTTLVTKVVDIVLLVVLACVRPYGGGIKTALVLATVHLTRTSFANCSKPLLRSILMDNVPRRHRAKVNALDGVRTFSWSGSAALGGLLINAFGFQTTFLITAGIKLGSTLPLFCLLPIAEDGLCTCQPRDLEEEAEAPLLGNAAQNGDEGAETMDDASEPMLIPPVDQGRLMAEMRASSKGHETPA